MSKTLPTPAAANNDTSLAIQRLLDEKMVEDEDVQVLKVNGVDKQDAHAALVVRICGGGGGG